MRKIRIDKKRICLLLIVIMILMLPVPSKITYASSKGSFTDVKSTDWHYNFVMNLTERGLIAGYPDGSFLPNNNIRVSEFTKILIASLGIEVSSGGQGHWAQGYIEVAKEIGVIKDKEYDNYDRPITRGEMARMIVRAGEGQGQGIKGQAVSLEIPQNYKEYASLITDYLTLEPTSQDIALKIFTSGIISGYPDGSFGFNKNATRAEASVILVRFLEPSQRKLPVLPEKVDFSDIVTVKEFTEMLLRATGETNISIDYAISIGVINPIDFPASYEKPLLRREAAKISARVLERAVTEREKPFRAITFDEASQQSQIFSSVIPTNDAHFYVDWERLYNESKERLRTEHPNLEKILDWENYRGNIKDIYMILPEYQKESVAMYLADILPLTDNNEFKPYSFVATKEAEEIAEKISKINQISDIKTINVAAKELPPMEKPNNEEIWLYIYPYINKSVYEINHNINVRLLSDAEARELINKRELPEGYKQYYKYEDKEDAYALFIEPYTKDIVQGSKSAIKNFNNQQDIINKFKTMTINYFKNRYNVDYRTLDESKITFKEKDNDVRSRIRGNYLERVKSYLTANATVKERIEDNWNNNIKPEIQKEIEEYKKYKVVSQAEFITDESLLYSIWDHNVYQKGTLRIIYYPPTDLNYLKSKGLEIGKWYEVDIYDIYVHGTNIYGEIYLDKNFSMGPYRVFNK